MMKTARRIAVRWLIALAGGMLLGSIAFGDDATTSPSATQPTMTAEQAMNDLQSTGLEVGQLIGTPGQLLDGKFRASIADRMIPLLKKAVSAAEALEAAQPDSKQQMEDTMLTPRSLLSLFGDAETTAELTKAAAGNGSDAVAARGALLLAKWLGDRSEAALAKGVADARALAQANPNDDSVTGVVVAMYGFPPDQQDQKEALQKIISDDLKTPLAQSVGVQFKAEEKLESLEGKPLVISGKEPDGTAFTTAGWKGKVILVDFWATWCGPCLQELPRVTKMYSDYHGTGLEVLGVSNDFSDADLAHFLAAHKDMPWPQLFDADAASGNRWNPITVGFGIEGIPTMFLIDKKEILRTVEARQSMEQLIPKLLDE
jgi:thiol-disulfide isomerase/thioredoxin